MLENFDGVVMKVEGKETYLKAMLYVFWHIAYRNFEESNQYCEDKKVPVLIRRLLNTFGNKKLLFIIRKRIASTLDPMPGRIHKAKIRCEPYQESDIFFLEVSMGETALLASVSCFC